MKYLLSGLATTTWLGILSASVVAQEMGQSELEALLSEGRTITLGGPGMGYSGSLTLDTNGVGSGSATTDAGQTIDLQGTWEVRDGKFFRRWESMNDEAEVCETWVRTSESSVDVMADGQKVGVNSW